MTELTYLFGTLAVLTGAMTSISVWAPRRVWLKLSAVAITAGLLPLAYAGFLQLLSMPKPVTLEWWHARAAEATVLGSSIREDEGIYLWLQLREVREPRAYALPWNGDLAEQLQTAQRDAAERQTEVRIRLPFEGSLDDREPKFYAMPHPESPPKELDPAGPQFYRRPAASDA